MVYYAAGHSEYLMYHIGVDIIEIGRIEGAMRRWSERFLLRIYTEEELQRTIDVHQWPGCTVYTREYAYLMKSESETGTGNCPWSWETVVERIPRDPP